MVKNIISDLCGRVSKAIPVSFGPWINEAKDCFRRRFAGWLLSVSSCCLSATIIGAAIAHCPHPAKPLFIIGVVAAIMALDIKSPMKAASIVLIFALAILENKSIVQDRTDAAVRDTTLINASNALVSNVTGLIPKVSQANAQLEALREQLASALKNNDEERAKELRRQIKIIEAQKDAAARNTLVIYCAGNTR